MKIVYALAIAFYSCLLTTSIVMLGCAYKEKQENKRIQQDVKEMLTFPNLS